MGRMTVDERRAVREALAPVGDPWSFTLNGLKLVCPACLSDEWMEGATVPLMHQRDQLPNGIKAFHFACPDCGLQEFSDFLLYDVCKNVPEDVASWN